MHLDPFTHLRLGGALMVWLFKYSGILAGMVLLSLGLINAASAVDNSSPGQSERKDTASGETHIIQADVLRIEGESYFVRGLDGKEMRLRADRTTMKTEQIKVGDRIEAKIDTNNHALSLLPAPY